MALLLYDEDGDRLDLKEVGGFGEPMLSLFVGDSMAPMDECGINLNLENAKRLRDWLTEFLDRATSSAPPR